MWTKLSAEGVQVQAQALKRYREFESITRILLKGQPTKVLTEFEEHHRVIIAAIQQDSSPHGHAPDDIFQTVTVALDGQVKFVANLFDGCAGTTLFVPDTNALLFNPNLEDWSFDGVLRFTVLLLPTIVSELDVLKVAGRTETLREKAEGLITRIKGYRARGQLTEGVPLRKGVSTLIAYSIEPNVKESLPWLDPANNDDRFLAGFLEVMREYPHSTVVLVTRDLNLQNKAEQARVCFVEPPTVGVPA